MSRKKLFLLDGHALVYRAHYAFINRPLINSKGLNTSAITGFTRFLWDVIRKEQPSHIAVAFDPPSPVFRHEMFPEYKANREEQPQDIGLALPYINKIVKAFNIPIIMVKGYEADDVIGTVAKQAEREGFEVFMVTPDKDYAQLVSENVFLYKPSRQGNGVDILGAPEILEKWEIKRVDQVIDILALQGDSVDNIPGIPGIGKKTAIKLLAKYDSLEGLLENTQDLKGKQKEKVETFADQGRLSKKLATIDIEVPIQFDAQACEITPYNRDELSALFKELEFRTLATQILGGSSSKQSVQGDLFNQTVQPVVPSTNPVEHSVADHNINNVEHTYHLVDTPEKRQNLIAELSKKEVFCFDSETTGIDANQAEIVGLAFAFEAHEAYYVPFPEDQEIAKAILSEFSGLFENEKIGKIAQNIKYDALILKWYGIELKGAFYDTMLMHYLLEPGLRHNMDYLAETYLKYQPVSITTLIGKKGKKQLTMRQVEVEKVKEYAAEDADITLQLNSYFKPKLAEAALSKLYYEIEEPLVKVLIDLEYEGINLNGAFLNSYSEELKVEIDRYEQQIYEKAGTTFNIASPKQVGEVLFDKLQIPYRWRKTKTGQYSTNEEKLTELALEYPFVQDILDYRGLTKLKSTYVDALPKMINPKSGRIHSSFNQALAATGRLSSNNPNLQNIPIRTPQGAKVREAFIPRDDNHILVAADYSQIELRLIAEISKDEAMLEAFKGGKDIHRATAAKVFDVDFDAVTKEQRYRAKTVNFSIIYGAGATNLSRQLGIKRTEAQEIIAQYFSKYVGLKNYMNEIVEFARTNGYVTTLLGRKRYLREINSNSSLERSNAERVAINTPIQGSAADMIKIAMVNIHEAFKEKGFQSKMVLQVHDELVFDVPTVELEDVKPVIIHHMQNAIPNLEVPIAVSLDTGENWRIAH